MQVVSDIDNLPGAFETASREAESAFGDGSIYVEKYLTRPRHIEIQVLGDQSGVLVHLGERECSIKRRHQKLIEESLAPLLEAGDREAMGPFKLHGPSIIGAPAQSSYSTRTANSTSSR